MQVKLTVSQATPVAWRRAPWSGDGGDSKWAEWLSREGNRNVMMEANPDPAPIVRWRGVFGRYIKSWKKASSMGQMWLA